MKKWIRFNAILIIFSGIIITVFSSFALAYSRFRLSSDDNWLLFSGVIFGILMIMCSTSYWKMKWLWTLIIYQCIALFIGLLSLYFFYSTSQKYGFGYVLDINNTIKYYGILISSIFSSITLLFILITLFVNKKANLKERR